MSYQAAYWSTLAVGMRGIRVDGNHAFMDFGCGKGRVLYLASWYKFGQIIGVELNPSMAGQRRVSELDAAAAGVLSTAPLPGRLAAGGRGAALAYGRAGMRWRARSSPA